MSTGSKKVIYAALAGNTLIAITKFIAAGITGSSAMLSEGIHSVVDTGNQGLLLYGLHRARQPADERFPFGHGKEVYFWSFIVALLIFAVGAGVSLYEGILHILHPEPISNPTVSYAVLAAAMLFEGGAWIMALKQFSSVKGRLGYLQAVHRGKDPTVFVVLFEDTAAMAGLVVAFLGIGLSQITGLAWFDGLASILIGCILGATAAWLAYETKSLLIGESAEPGVIEDIRAQLRSNPRVEHVNEILTMHMGPDYILVTLSVDFADAISAHDMEITIAAMDREIKRLHPHIKRIFIEAEARRRPQ